MEMQFGTAANPSAAQQALIAEMQSRYKAFLSSGQPNAPGVPQWTAADAGSSDVHALNLGAPGEVLAGACDPGFWGQQVPFDYQIFKI
jgi:hypothetical protein